MSSARPAPAPPSASAEPVLPPGRLGDLSAAVFAAGALTIVGVQAYVSVGAARSFEPLGARDARSYVLAYVLVVASIAGLALVVPRRLLWLPAAAGGLASATALAAVATAGGEAWSLATAALTLAAAWALGNAALRLRRVAGEGLFEAPLVALVAGLGLLGLAIFLLGLAGLLAWWTVGIGTVAVGFLGLRRLLWPRARDAGRLVESLTQTRLRATAAGILGLQGGFAVIWAAAPEIQFDALQYKAWLPALWASTGEIDSQTFIDHPTTTYLGLAQLAAVPGHAVEAPAVGRYLQLFIAAIIVVAVWRLGDRVGSAIGPLAALVVGLTPHVLWQASTAYDDLFLTLLVLGGAMATLHFEGRPVRDPVAASAVIAFVAATCLSGKVHLAPYVLGLCAGWVLVSSGLREARQRTVGVFAGALLGLGPLLAYRWIEMGNPIFPYFNQIFGSQLFRTDDPLTRTTGSTESGFIGLLRFPWHLVHDARVGAGIEFAAAGVFGLLVLALVGGLLLGWRGSGPRRVVWGALALGAFWWWIQFRYLRFLFPYAVLALIVLLPSLAPLESLLRRRLAAAAAVVVVAVGAAVFFVSTLGSFWNVPGRVPLSVAVGQESERTYERTAIPDAAALEVLNERAEPGAHVTGWSYARALLRLDIDLDRDFDTFDRLKLHGTFSTDPALMKAALDGEGIRWVVLGDQQRLLDERTGALGPVVLEYGEIVDAEQGRDLYELVDSPAPPHPVQLCDSVFLKPECWFGVVPEGLIPFNNIPGLQSDEVHGEPVGQAVPACGGATYALTVTTGPGEEPTRAYLVFGPNDTERVRRLIDAPPARTSILYGTAPAGATSASIVLDPLGPSSEVEQVSLATAGADQPAGTCP